MKKRIFTGILLLLFACLAGCTSTKDPASRQAILFDTVIQIRIYDTNSHTEEILDTCIKQCEEYEKQFSRTMEGSDIYRLNHANGEPVELSEETIELLSLALTYCELSDGAFDITLAPISDLWDFQNNTGTLPSDADLTEALRHVNYKNIQINNHTVQLLDPETEVDLGGIAKGYIADQLKAFLIDEGVEHALIDLGGNILTLGGKPDGSDFHIAIQKPFDTSGSAITTVDTKNASVISSGIYQRYVEIDDRIYHHILNPQTGYPYQNHLLGVTIISDSSANADALSTTCFALGLEKGLDLINTLDDAEAVFITDEYELVYSEGFPRN